MSLTFSPLFVFQVLLGSIFILLSLNVLGIYLNFNDGIHLPKSLKRALITLFDFNKEGNFPTFFSALMLIFSAILLYTIACFKKRSGTGHLSWLGLALTFLFLSFDEAASIHELLSPVTKSFYHFSGYFYYAWIVPYVVGLIILTGIYMPFIIKELSGKTRILFLVSGVIFVSGAIGFEMLGGKSFESQGENSIYIFYYTCEELLEMLGVALFIYTLLLYLTENFNRAYVKLTLKNIERKV